MRGIQSHRQKKIGASREEHAAIGCLESVSSSRATSQILAKSARRDATEAGSPVCGSNILA